MRRALGLALICIACGARTSLGSAGTDGSAPIDVTCKDPADTWLIFEVNTPADAKLYATRSDGANLHALPIPDLRAIYPAVSPDGKTLAYSSVDAAFHSAIKLYDLVSGTSRVVVNVGGRPAFSPEGTRLAYGNGMDVKLVGLDGTGETLLVKGPSPQQTGYGNPSFLLGGKVVFDRGGGVESIATDGSARTTLLVEDGNAVTFPNPSISFDRTKLAAVVDCGGTVALRTWSIASLPAACTAGALWTEIDLGGVNASSSAWSPDGKIALTQGKEILVVPAGGGTTAVDVTKSLGLDGQNAGASHPVFTPPCAKVP